MSRTPCSGFLLILVIVTTVFRTSAQESRHGQMAFHWVDAFHPDSFWIAQKNVGLLSMILRDEPLKKWLSIDSGFSGLLIYMKRRQRETAGCPDPDCYVNGFSIPDSVTETAAERLGALWKEGNLLDRMLKTKLIPSGLYYQYHDSAAPAQLRLALKQDLGAVNYILAVYAGGTKPNYPLIDSISLDVNGKQYVSGILYTSASVLRADSASDELFFQYPLRAALLFLELNGRNEPAGYEPMERTVNREAVAKITGTPWSTFPYTVILVPGAGPGEGSTAMSAAGMLRCRLAAEAWRHKKAPYIMVSGGKVHPYKTVFCEAEEMKNYLRKNLHIPASAMIMEPHARHTTTNMRNAARLIYRYHIPDNRPALVISDRLQTFSITMMAPRCIKELKYVPYWLGRSLSETTLEFFPLPDALQINPTEPLDP